MQAPGFSHGVADENKLIETEKKDFIGQYKGETSIKTAEVIDKALGGVLFIDEDYGLSPTHPSDPAHEAIAVLIKAMEDHKGEFIVIFAWYKDEMSVLIQNEVNKILKECYNDSEKILSENKEQVLKLVDYLLEYKEIDEEQFLYQL